MKVILTGGGTMGHITPLLNFKKELEKRGDYEFYYLGNENRVEKKIAEKNNIPFFHIPSEGTGNIKTFDGMKNFIKTNLAGMNQARKVMKELNADFIISTGGFVTAPVLAMARIPYFMHEQNRVLGKVNKLFVMKAREIYYTFENTKGGQEKRKGETLGNPVENFSLNSQGTEVLFLGGSGGADYINNLALEYAVKNPQEKVVLQAGEKRKPTVEGLVVGKGLKNVEVVGFEEMSSLLNRACLIVSRAGSTTINELIENEKPAMVIPFPQAADNHQVANAMYLVEKKMGWTAVESEEIDKVIEKINKMKKQDELNKMKENMKTHKKMNVAKNIVDDILDKL